MIINNRFNYLISANQCQPVPFILPFILPFLVTSQKIYDIIPGNNAIYCNRKFGPIFCAKPDSSAYSIFIPDNYLKNKSTTTKKCYCYKMEENFELNKGTKEFQVKELEVFRVDTD